MAKPHGTYTKIHESLADHPKTLDLANRLSPVLGMSADMAVAFVFMGVAKLACYCIRESETGEIGHLTDGKFCDAIGLPREVSDVRAVADAWRQSGFIDKDGSSVKLHEFEFYAGSLIRDRERKRATRSADSVHETSADRPRNVPGQSKDSRARVRKTEDGIRKTEREGATPPSSSAAAPGEDGAAAAPLSRPKPKPDSKPRGGLSSNPAIAAVQARWRDGPGGGTELPGTPAHGGWGGFAKRLRTELDAKGVSEPDGGDRLLRAVDAYLSCRLDWCAHHPLHLFVEHFDRWWQGNPEGQQFPALVGGRSRGPVPGRKSAAALLWEEAERIEEAERAAAAARSGGA